MAVLQPAGLTDAQPFFLITVRHAIPALRMPTGGTLRTLGEYVTSLNLASTSAIIPR